ncbi:hypothetical protein R1sor_016036 [Riccia sorocarpa]|uniref:Uncharacterized protein n=1 Tax=Riccia sorocarpa TaxID=122646 RepID=A0ABD3HH13_9MARC
MITTNLKMLHVLFWIGGDCKPTYQPKEADHINLRLAGGTFSAVGNMKSRKGEGAAEAGKLDSIKTKRLSNVIRRKTAVPKQAYRDSDRKENSVKEISRSARKNGGTAAAGSHPMKAPTVPLETYRISGTGKVVRAGDSVLIQAPEKEKSPNYVARIEKIEKIQQHGKKESVSEKILLKVRWFYYPEETITKRQAFHGAQELYLSDHYDTQEADCILDKCRVHTFKEYCKLKEVDSHDFFWRFEYKPAVQQLSPDAVEVFCVCELPENPDHFMVQCESCTDWFHPACIGLSEEVVAGMERYVCAECSQ